jgi:GAF domain-containing protein
LLILFAPIRSDGELAGILEIFQRPNTTPAAQQGFLRFLDTLSEIAADFTRRQELRNLRDRSALWAQYEAFAERVHSDLDLDRTAFVLANDGRGLIGCDRVSVLLVKGHRNCKLKAMSGQDTVDRRANPVRLLEQLCAAVVRTNEPLWYHEDAGNLPPQLGLAMTTATSRSAPERSGDAATRRPPSCLARRIGDCRSGKTGH